MSSARPEKITLKIETKTPELVESVYEILNTELHKQAKLTRTNEDGYTLFSFNPTRSEYFLIRLKLTLLNKFAQ